MKISRSLAAVAALAWACAGACAAGDPIEAQAVARAAAARHAAAADRRAARSLVAEGDAAYRAGRYDDAHRDFDNATANLPGAYAFLMTADSHWRASVAFGRAQAASAPATAGCRLQRRYLVDDLRLDLDQGYRLGLRMAPIEPGHPLAGSAFLARARGSADCLARVTDELAPLPPETCVDEARIAACLGASLRR